MQGPQRSRQSAAQAEARTAAPPVRDRAGARRGQRAAVPPPLTADVLRAAQSGAGNAVAAAMVARRARPSGPAAEPAGTGVQEVLRSAGKPFAGPVREEMEARFGTDFSDVRLHTGPAAARSAAAIGARAYTAGSNVVIGDGGGDKHTLAHELTHVVQQRSGPVAGSDSGHGFAVSDPGDRFERDAEANASRVMSGPVPVQKSEEEGVPDAGRACMAGQQVQRVVLNTNAAPTQSHVHPVPETPAGMRTSRTRSIEMITDGSLSGSPPGLDPPGYQYIRALSLTNFWVRFHLINEQAGGPGAAANLVPASKRDNSQYEKSIESVLKQQVDAVRNLNSPLQAGAARHYVYFGVDVHYGAANASTTQTQQDNAPYFVRYLRVHLKQFDPAANAWGAPTFNDFQFTFQDPQPDDPGTSVAAANLTLPMLTQLTGARKGEWKQSDVDVLNAIGGSRQAEFAALLDKHATDEGAAEAAYGALWELPVKRGSAVSFGANVDEDLLITLGELIGTGRITT